MNSLRTAFLLLAPLLVATAAGAATAKANPGAGAFATRDQLRDCLALDDTLKARGQVLQASVVAHNKRMDENDAEDARLVEAKKTLDRSDKAAIRKFNEAVVAHKHHVDEADQEGAAMQKSTQALKDDQADADQKCASLTYRPADLEAVGRDRKKAAAVAAAASAP